MITGGRLTFAESTRSAGFSSLPDLEFSTFVTGITTRTRQWQRTYFKITVKKKFFTVERYPIDENIAMCTHLMVGNHCVTDLSTLDKNQCDKQEV